MCDLGLLERTNRLSLIIKEAYLNKKLTKLDLQKYEVILFDAGDTLITKEPSAMVVFIERCESIGITIDSIYIPGTLNR